LGLEREDIELEMQFNPEAGASGLKERRRELAALNKPDYIS
jgi:hypothetical protein